MKEIAENNGDLFYKEVEKRLKAYRAGEEKTHTREEVMKEFGISEDDLKETEEAEFRHE